MNRAERREAGAAAFGLDSLCTRLIHINSTRNGFHEIAFNDLEGTLAASNANANQFAGGHFGSDRHGGDSKHHSILGTKDCW